MRWEGALTGGGPKGMWPGIVVLDHMVVASEGRVLGGVDDGPTGLNRDVGVPVIGEQAGARCSSGRREDRGVRPRGRGIAR